jgi:hypothetical protein
LALFFGALLGCGSGGQVPGDAVLSLHDGPYSNGDGMPQAQRSASRTTMANPASKAAKMRPEDVAPLRPRSHLRLEWAASSSKRDAPDLEALTASRACPLHDGRHVLALEGGDSGASARGFFVLDEHGTTVFDGTALLESFALVHGMHPDPSLKRGVKLSACGVGRFVASGAEETHYAFLLGANNASLVVLDVSTPYSPAVVQVLTAPWRPEKIAVFDQDARVMASGADEGELEGDVYYFKVVEAPGSTGYDDSFYVPVSKRVPFGGISGMAWDPTSQRIVATPDCFFERQRIWWFYPEPASRRMLLERELSLADTSGEPLAGYDPEGIALLPGGGFVIVSEGGSRNGGSRDCKGSSESNRLLFFARDGKLDGEYGDSGIVDLPCGNDDNAIDWSKLTSFGFEGVAVRGGAGPGLKVYALFQRPLSGEGRLARIGEYDTAAGAWRFYYYPLDRDPGGAAGRTLLSELVHLGGDRFAVIERDQGRGRAAVNKSVRVFSLASGTADDRSDPVDKVMGHDLLQRAFPFDQEKIEGLALDGESLWVSNDNDEGRAANLFMKLAPP